MITEPILSVWAEIDLKALKKNVEFIRSLIDKDTKIMGVIKFNAYGHGAVEIGRVLLENGVHALGVAKAEEGIELRKAGIEDPILIMDMSFPEEAGEIVRYSLTPMVSSIELADALECCSSKEQKKTGIHIRVDTSMGNIGVQPADFKNFLKKIKMKKNLTIEGFFTHLVSVYRGDKEIIDTQMALFQELLFLLDEEEMSIPLIHASSSPGIFRLPEANFSMVRIGTSLYGLPSFKNQNLNGLEPVMQLKTRIVSLHSLQGIYSLGYTGSISINKYSKIAVIPVGYGDIPSLMFIKNGEVLVNGKIVPVLGKAFMGHMLIDVSRVPQADIGDEVVIFGRQLEQRITAEEIAEKSGAGVERCESICMFDRKIKRIYIK